MNHSSYKKYIKEIAKHLRFLYGFFWLNNWFVIIQCYVRLSLFYSAELIEKEWEDQSPWDADKEEEKEEKRKDKRKGEEKGKTQIVINCTVILA